MNYTSIEQSKKLLELGLPAESADMYYSYMEGDIEEPHISVGFSIEAYNNFNNTVQHYIPCWSIGALLEVMPKKMEETKGHTVTLIVGKPKKSWSVTYFDWTGLQHGHETTGDTLIKAVYDMVVWLLENNYIKKG